MENNTQSVEVEAVEKCLNCRVPLTAEQTLTHHGERQYCDDCYQDEFYRECDNCGTSAHREDMYFFRGGSLCESCYDSARNEDNEDSEAESDVYRMYSPKNLKEFQSRYKGDIITSPRIFSAEIECYYPSAVIMSRVSAELPQAIGIDGDGSLNHRGVEIQTPKLKGARGETQLRDLCTTLMRNKFTVDTAAGLHIHLDGKGLVPKTAKGEYGTVAAFKQLWMFYILFEDVMLSFLPKKRRNNNYCPPIKRLFHVNEVTRCNSRQELEKLWYKERRMTEVAERKRHAKDSSRYCGVNLHSLLAQGHLEIRYHSGTINPIKVLEWINLHQRVMDMAQAHRLSNYFGGLDTELSLAAKTRTLFDALELSKESRKYFLKRQRKFLADDNAKEGTTLEEITERN